MKNNFKPQTVKDTLQEAVLFLGENKRLDCELLLAKVLSCSRAILLAYPELELKQEQWENFSNMLNKRKEGYPLQYLTGVQNFMGLDFLVTPAVLIPRSDTEVLVEHALEYANSLKIPEIKILDLCTGSGAIAISLAKYIPQAKIIATDISRPALKVAIHNAQANDVADKITFLQGDLFQPVPQEKFHLIVSNPPYVNSQEMKELSAEVNKEPHSALWGGEDGLMFYTPIINDAINYLFPNSLLMVEIGWQQGKKVSEIFNKSNYKEINIIKDWQGNERVVYGKKGKYKII